MRPDAFVCNRPFADVAGEHQTLIAKLTRKGRAAMASGDIPRVTFHTAIVVCLLGCGPKPAASTEGPAAAPSTLNSQAGPADLGQCPTYMGAPGSDADRDMLWNSRANAQPLCLFISSVAWAE